MVTHTHTHARTHARTDKYWALAIKICCVCRAASSSGSLMVQCEIRVGDVQGLPIISLPIHLPPVCGALEGSGCLHIPRNDSTFPDNAFVANAIRWSTSAVGQLVFEFGLLAADGSRVQLRGDVIKGLTFSQALPTPLPASLSSIKRQRKDGSRMVRSSVLLPCVSFSECITVLILSITFGG
eukprot:1157525-Pelagomonas_calceolata.AAC.3